MQPHCSQADLANPGIALSCVCVALHCTALHCTALPGLRACLLSIVAVPKVTDLRDACYWYGADGLGNAGGCVTFAEFRIEVKPTCTLMDRVTNREAVRQRRMHAHTHMHTHTHMHAHTHMQCSHARTCMGVGHVWQYFPTSAVSTL